MLSQQRQDPASDSRRRVESSLTRNGTALGFNKVLLGACLELGIGAGEWRQCPGRRQYPGQLQHPGRRQCPGRLVQDDGQGI